MQSNKVTQAIETIAAHMDAKNAFIVAWSGGKDSSTVLNLVFMAALTLLAENRPIPRIIVTHADTYIENPAVGHQSTLDIHAMRRWAEENGLDLTIKLSKPNLNELWPVRVIGGRDLPVFSGVGSDRKCTMEFKIKPQERLVRKLVKGIKKDGGVPITVTGTRFAESASRAGRMTDRGEVSDEIWLSDAGEARLSPIADWSDADVWQYLHACAAGKHPSYADFSGLIRLYREGSDPADIQTLPDGTEVYACRFGCALCTAGKDKSMAWLLKNNPDRYGYMAGLHALQQYLVNTQHDLDLRQWLNFSISDDGYAALRPNTYSPSMLEDLFRMCLTLDVRERRAARTAGRHLRFQIITAEVLIAIDAIWSLQGHHEAHHAMRIYKEVLSGKLMDIPTVEPIAKTPVPSPRYVYVGMDWQDPKWRNAGLWDSTLAHFAEESGCMGSRTLSNGLEIMDVNHGPELSIDPESAHCFFEFELDRVLEQNNTSRWRTSAYFYYARMGIITLAKGPHLVKIDHILKRTMWKQEKGLLGLDMRKDPENIQALLDASISKKELDDIRIKLQPEPNVPVASLVTPAPVLPTSLPIKPAHKLVQGSLFDFAA